VEKNHVIAAYLDRQTVAKQLLLSLLVNPLLLA